LPIKIYGKQLVGNVTVKNKSNEKKDIKNITIHIGTLDSTLDLYGRIEIMLNTGEKIKKLYLNNKEINWEEEKSLISLGIKDDFNVIVEL